MIKVVTYANVLDFYFWANSEHSRGWIYRTKVVDDKLLVYMEREKNHEQVDERIRGGIQAPK